MLKKPLYIRKDLFRVPAGYFDELPERILNRIAREQPVPRLDTIPRESSWKLPEGYFDALPERIIEAGSGADQFAVRPENSRADISRTPVFRLKEYVQTGIAACLVLGMSILGILQIVEKSDTMPDPAYTRSAGPGYPEYSGELPLDDVLDLEEELFIEHYLEGYSVSQTRNPLEEYAIEHIEEDILTELY